MTNKIRVKNITIDLGNKKSVTLTIDEARELYQQLSGLFEERVHYLQPTPIYINPAQPPWTWQPSVTWCNNSVTAESDVIRITYSGDSE